MLTVKRRPRFLPGPIRLQLYLVFLFIKKMKLRKVIIRIRSDVNFLFVFPSPVPLPRPDAKELPLGQVGMHNGVYGECEVFMLMIDQIA